MRCVVLVLAWMAMSSCDVGPEERAIADAAGADARDLVDASRPVPDASVIPDAGIPDAVISDGCATAPTGDWLGWTRRFEGGNGIHVDLRADVRWTVVATQGCIDVLKPSGVATYRYTSMCDPDRADPGSAEIHATDGELVIDRSVSPATYRVTGTTTWDATQVCGQTTHAGVVGGPWVDAEGEFTGAVIAGTLHVAEQVPDELPEVIVAWDFRRADASLPAPEPCAEPPTDTWTFAGSITEGASAEITWTRVATEGCRDRFVPAGTATVSPPASALEGCDPLVYTPRSVTVAAGDGTLVIDRSTSPPTYEVSGATTWSGSVTCTHADGEVTTGDADLGGPWASARGAYDGAPFAAATTHRNLRYAWRFGR